MKLTIEASNREALLYSFEMITYKVRRGESSGTETDVTSPLRNVHWTLK